MNRYNPPKPNNDLIKILMKPHYNSFYASFYRYSIIINNYPMIIKKNHISNYLKEDIKKLDEYNKEILFLSKNKIESNEELNTFINNKYNELEKLLPNRHENEEEIIKIKEDIKLCECIRVKETNIDNNLEELERNDSYEYVR